MRSKISLCISKFSPNPIWLLAQIGGPLRGCPYTQSSTVWKSTSGPLIFGDSCMASGPSQICSPVLQSNLPQLSCGMTLKLIVLNLRSLPEHLHDSLAEAHRSYLPQRNYRHVYEISMYTYMYVYTNVYKSMHLCIYTYIYTCIHKHARAYVCIYIYIYIFIYASPCLVSALRLYNCHQPSLAPSISVTNAPKTCVQRLRKRKGLDGDHIMLISISSMLLYLNQQEPVTAIFPEAPSTQCFSSLVPNTIKSMVFGTRNLKYWVLGLSGIDTSRGPPSGVSGLGPDSAWPSY